MKRTDKEDRADKVVSKNQVDPTMFHQRTRQCQLQEAREVSKDSKVKTAKDNQPEKKVDDVPKTHRMTTVYFEKEKDDKKTNSHKK